MTTKDPRDRSADAGPPPTAGAAGRARALLAVLALAFSYLGFVLGAPSSDPRPIEDRPGLERSAGSHRLALREGARDEVRAERRDRSAPPPPAAPALAARIAARGPVPARVAAPAAPRAAPAVEAAGRRAHPPRAPPVVAAT